VYFRVLGPLDGQINGSAIRLDSGKQRVLLSALLAAPNEVVPLERLIEWCWPRRPPRSATATVQAHVCRLRRAIEPHRPAWASPEVLVWQSPGYLLRIAPGQLDMQCFEHLIAAGRAALERDDPVGAADSLGRALALWRGPPLADLAHIDAAQPTLARLEALRLSALTTRIDADLRLGREQALIPELSALVRRHPYDERLCGQLMVALYRSGRQAESLEVYERIRYTLAKELDIVPAPASRRLREAIREQDPCLERDPVDRPDNGSSATG